MSVGTDVSPEQAASPSSAAAPAKDQQSDGDNATRPGANSTSKPEHAKPDAKTDPSPESESKDSSSAQINSTSSLLSSLWSPISSLLQSSTSPATTNSEQSNKAPSTPPTPTKPEELKVTQEPEPYYTPSEIPLFKTLQKTRLSGTRTKQLLRAASRAYNDPPPSPELGSCCGSSCDPCVNDLWREERDVWRGRWGDKRVENSGGSEQGEEGDGKRGGEGGKEKKELEW